MSMRSYLLLVILLALPGCTGLFFYPSSVLVRTPADIGLSYEDLRLESADGTELHAWLLPAQGAAVANVLFLHGNAENISSHIASVFWLPGFGVNVLLLDYRGFGLSSGSPTVEGSLLDIEEALSYLFEEDPYSALPTAIFGQSLGAAFALHTAAHFPARERLCAVIAEGSFSSYRRIAREKLASVWLTALFSIPLSYAFEDRYSPERSVERLAPVRAVFVHGDEDRIVPVHHSDRLFDLASEPKEYWRVAGAGHIEIFTRADWRHRFVKVLESCEMAETYGRQE